MRGVWGPYFSAMLPGYWLNEGGQSATGALLDFIMSTHPRFPEVEAEARRTSRSTYEVLNADVDRLAKAEGSGTVLS